jgi:hypothetical protein
VLFFVLILFREKERKNKTKFTKLPARKGQWEEVVWCQAAALRRQIKSEKWWEGIGMSLNLMYSVNGLGG